MDTCAPHREFLAAIADGETALVPPATLEHVGTCADCKQEIRAHGLLSSRLQQGSVLIPLSPARPRRLGVAPRPLRVIAAGLVASVLVVGIATVWFLASRPDPVQAAAVASHEPLQVQSNDPTRVALWCMQASGRKLPAVQLDGMRIMGARMDRVGSTGIVTVVYSSPSGERVTVGWLEGDIPSGAGVEDAQRSGLALLIVHARVGTAVIAGSSTDAMWQAAAAIESAPQ